jgi:hypothetical protein
MSKSTPQTTTTSSNTAATIPDWLSSAGQQAVQMGQDLSTQPYTPYSGQIVAGQTPDTSQAYQQIEGMQGYGAPAFQQAANQWSGVLGDLQSLTPGQTNQQTNQLYGNYQQGVLNPAAQQYQQATNTSQGLLGGYLQGGPLTAQQVGAGAQALMSPYTSSVIDPTNQLMQQQLHQNLQQIGAAANQAGAFGGSRQGVQEGVAQSQAALGSEQYLGNLLNNQWNTALPQAEAIGALGSQQGYGAAGQLASQGYGTAGALSQLGASGYGTAAQQGLNMAGTNLQTGMNAAQQIPGLATQWQANDLGQTNALSAAGSAQQQQQQALLNAQMGQYYQQQDWPVQGLDTLLSSLTGVPYNVSGQTSGTSTTPQTSNLLSGGLGLLTSGASIGNSLGLFGPAALAAA